MDREPGKVAMRTQICVRCVTRVMLPAAHADVAERRDDQGTAPPLDATSFESIVNCRARSSASSTACATPAAGQAPSCTLQLRHRENRGTGATGSTTDVARCNRSRSRGDIDRARYA